LVGLRGLYILFEEALEGFLQRRIGFIFIFWFLILGEFPLVEGSFRNLIQIDFPDGLSSLDDKNLHVLESILLFLIDRDEVMEFAERNLKRLFERKNYGYFNKYHN